MTSVAPEQPLTSVLADRGPLDDVPPPPARPGLAKRLVSGRPDDPRWVRPALILLLLSTAVAYLWALGDSGWANSFYSAAVQAGTKSWKAFFFGSFDGSNFITVDKPPAALWVMELSARLFGVNSWSILVPQAIEGVATVGLLYATVRRWFSPGAALLAGAVVAVTPVAALMFRFNNPDALLVLLLTASAYATVRALERASTRWIVLAAALVGTAFLTKMLQALVVVPAIGVVYLIAAPTPVGRRLRQVLAAGVALVVSAGWWVVAVQLVPAASRPYIGGSQDNSLWNLIFGYNGFGRLSGSETGSVGGAGPTGSMWGPTGWTRLFNSQFGGQIAWLIPAALVLLVASLWVVRRAPRTDRTRAALLLWGLTLLITGAVFSFAKGIIHPYYSVALAPAVGALVGMGCSVLWPVRDKLPARLALAGSVGATAAWSYVLLDRSPQWFPALRFFVLVVGIGVAFVIALAPRLRGGAAVLVGALALASCLSGSAAYAMDTVVTPHSGAIPSAGPTVAGVFGQPGGGPPGGALGGPGALTGPGGASGGAGGGAGGASGTGPGGASGQNGFGGANGPFGAPPSHARSNGLGGLPGRLPGAAGGSQAFPGAPGAGRSGARGNGPGGLLSGSHPSKALVSLLEKDQGRFTWVAATVGSNSASGYQLATGDPVMAIGGFNGSDPAPTLAQFEGFVRSGKIHYFIAGGAGLPGGGGFRGAGGASQGTSSSASAITQWVESHFSSSTVGGVTVYDLTSSSS
jgi:4-amino-4-deoxy-L-arabinose transferase-like glycosyltransferase